MKQRRRLAVLLAVAVAPVATTLMALPAHALSPNDDKLDPCTSVPGNLVVNCGFEAPVVGGTIPGWTHLVGNGSGVTSTANSGTHALGFQSTGRDDVWTQTIPVLPHTDYLVGAQFNASTSTPNDVIAFTATNVNGSPGAGAVIFSSVDTNLAWERGAQVVTTGSGRTMTLTLSGRNVPSQTQVDDVFALPQRSGCAAIANNLVSNCGFEAATAGPWHNPVQSDSQINSNSNGGVKGLRLASFSGTDDVWNQTFTVRPHTKYSLTYWVEYSSNASTPFNDLTVSVSNVSGSLNITTTNVPNRFWAPVTRTFTTGAGLTATLTITGSNHPAQTNVDDFSVTAVPHLAVSAKHRKLTTVLTGVGGQKVLLERFVHQHWVTFRSFAAPKTGASKSWTVSVPAGKYRAVALATPGYASTTSATITVH